MACRAKLNILLITAALLLGALCTPAHTACWQGGGTTESPYLIYDANDMQAIGANPDDWDKHFKLMTDIDMSSSGQAYEVIGNSTTMFTGVFDGDGHNISNFIYNSTSTTYAGLFGYVYGAGAMIKDLCLLNPVINVNTRAGTLVTTLREGTVAGCSAEGVSVLTGDTSTGGLIAVSYNGTIFNCYSSGSISGLSSVGGLIGIALGGTISNCTSTVNVSGNGDRVGGLIGFNWGGVVSNCYSTGIVSGFDLVGGLMGRNYNGMVNNCYSTGPVSGTGGFVGGLVGKNDGEDGSSGIVLHSFWDRQTSGQTGGDGSTGTDKTTAKMQDMNTFLDAGWDFVGETTNGPSDDWSEPAGGGYPVLWWQLPEGSLPGLPTFSGGTGESNNPYLISTAAELNSIGHNWRLMEEHYKLVSDIDLTGVDFFTIGGDGIPFAGVFYGNNYIVSNFTYRVSQRARQIGFFDCILGPTAEIRDLSLTDPNVIADAGEFVGSLGGCLKTGTISNCRVQNGYTSGIRHVGGLVGWNKAGTITNCRATGSVLGNEDYIGGLVGTNDGLVTDCYAAGSIEGSYDTGGLVGWNYTNGTISNSCAISSVSGYSSVGGLVGENEAAILNCCSSGAVTGYGSHVGGLVGENYDADIFASFWDTQTSGEPNGIGYNSGSGTAEVYGRTTAEMQAKTTFTNYGWDFVGEAVNGTEDIWRMCIDGVEYPKLYWQFMVGDFLCPDGVNLIDFSFFAEHWLNDNCGAINDCNQTDLDLSNAVDTGDLQILSNHWLTGAGESINIELSLNDLWMYQNLPTKTDSNIIASVSMIDDQYNNSSYTYEWEFILPDDVSIPPITVDGGGPADPCFTFAAPSCNESAGLSDSGQTFTIKVTVTGNDYGNTATAEAQFGIALLGDVNNDTFVDGPDRGIINTFRQTGSAGEFTLRDCQGFLGQNSVSNKCQLR
jgi:hypothetical protein